MPAGVTEISKVERRMLGGIWVYVERAAQNASWVDYPRTKTQGGQARWNLKLLLIRLSFWTLYRIAA